MRRDGEQNTDGARRQGASAARHQDAGAARRQDTSGTGRQGAAGPHRTRFVALSWAAVAAMAALIFWMSANTGDSINSGLGIVSAVKALLADAAAALAGHEIDVSPIGHFAEYFLFGALLFNALRLHMGTRRALVLALVVASAYGITDEWHQYFVPDRSCDPADWLVDTVAGAAGAAAMRCLLRLRHRSCEQATHTR